jgi:hypothetical protein
MVVKELLFQIMKTLTLILKSMSLTELLSFEQQRGSTREQSSVQRDIAYEIADINRQRKDIKYPL